MKKSISNDDTIYLSIKQVAKELYIVPATLRNWEKAGLIKPKRFDNNYRAYTLEDLNLLKKIRNLSLEGNMTMSAIRVLLYGETNTIPQKFKNNETGSHKYSKKLINSRWKASREKMNLTVQEVSDLTGINLQYIESIENGNAEMKIETLSELAIFYGESILYFFEIKEVDSIDAYVVKKNKGEVAEIGLDGVRTESLIQKNNHIIFPMLFTIKPGSGSKETHRHKGEEFIYILSGELKVTLNYDKTYTLRKGDSMYFKSKEYHHWENTSKYETKLLWVHSSIDSYD